MSQDQLEKRTYRLSKDAYHRESMEIEESRKTNREKVEEQLETTPNLRCLILSAPETTHYCAPPAQKETHSSE